MRYLIVGTAGHIDHGKSTLVRALTGIDPDRLKEEKARGITIDLGFAHDVRGDVTLAFVDVPGHERFVKNMLAGATGIDVLLLVIAADESIMPQTREHFDICRLLQVRRGVVALTKADLVDSETLELVRMEAREMVAGSFLADAPVVPVSAVTGLGLEALRTALLEAAGQGATRRREGAFRLPIDRVFSVKGFGTVVTGTVTSGQCALDMPLDILPSNRPVKVRSIQGHGMALTEVGAGQRAAINVAGVEVGDVERGDCLVAAGAFEPTRRLDAELDVLASARPLKHGGRVRFHLGTGETLGRVAIARVLPTADGVSADPAQIPSGGRAFVRLRLEKPVVATRGDAFVLRAYSPPVTIAGGIVLDPHPLRTAIRSASGQERFQALSRGGADASSEPEVARVVRALVREAGLAGLPQAALVTRVGVSASEAASLAARLGDGATLVRIGERLLDRGALDDRRAKVRAVLGEYHRSQPLSEGMPREELRERLFGRADVSVFDAVVDGMVRAKSLVGRERLALASHRVTLSDAGEQVRLRLEQLFRDAGLRPPDAATVSAALDSPAAAVDQALTLLQRQKILVKLDTLWFHASALEQLKNDVRALKTQGTAARVDVGAFKDRYGVSRKFAIPLLEYLDRERVTRRMGDSRVVL